MGRRRQGPIKLNRGDTWYARLTVPPADRAKAGKTRLIRSLKTTSHSVALSRYGAAYSALEKELRDLLQGASFRERIKEGEEGELREKGDHKETALELTEIQVGPIDEDNPEHQAIYEFYESGKPIPISWDEAIELWVREKSRSNSRPIAKGSIAQAKTKVKFISPLGTPSQINKQIIRRYIEQREIDVSPTTVSSDLKILSAITDVLVSLDHVEHNSFKDVKYNVGIKSKKKAFTDEQIRLLSKTHKPAFLMIQTGMRPGELQWGRWVEEEMVKIIKPVYDDKGKELWRPKSDSSERRVVLSTDFKMPKYKYRQWVDSFRLVIEDFQWSLHSGRHTFIELSRRAGCDSRIIEEYCGHGSKTGSTSHAGYGRFPDEVLRREAEKVWALIKEIVEAKT